MQIQAELIVAKRNGCDVIEDIVSRVQQINSSEIPSSIKQNNNMADTDVIMKLTTDTCRTIFARKVLLATGAFTQLRKLLPDDVTPDIDLITQAVVYAELSPDDLDKYR